VEVRIRGTRDQERGLAVTLRGPGNCLADTHEALKVSSADTKATALQFAVAAGTYHVVVVGGRLDAAVDTIVVRDTPRLQVFSVVLKPR
jgi:hypothetical protein